MASGRSGLTKVLRGNRDVSDAAAMKFTEHSQEWLCYWCCATGAVLRRGFAAAPNWAVGTDDNGADLRYKDAGPSSHPTSSFAHVPRSILPYCCTFVCTCAAGRPPQCGSNVQSRKAQGTQAASRCRCETAWSSIRESRDGYRRQRWSATQSTERCRGRLRIPA